MQEMENILNKPKILPSKSKNVKADEKLGEN
jgi:hypothetical protein